MLSSCTQCIIENMTLTLHASITLTYRYCLAEKNTELLTKNIIHLQYKSYVLILSKIDLQKMHECCVCLCVCCLDHSIPLPKFLKDRSFVSANTAAAVTSSCTCNGSIQRTRKENAEVEKYGATNANVDSALLLIPF